LRADLRISVADIKDFIYDAAVFLQRTFLIADGLQCEENAKKKLQKM